MSLLELLATGRLGMTLRLPAAWPIATEGGANAELVDPERGVGWWVFAAEGLHLDLGEADAEGLAEAARGHARFMFEDVHARDEASGGPPRTSDPDWSPMVDFERGELQGSPVLRSIHRMSYRPGREIVLGHLLVPRPWGLFEARVAAADQATGMRESVHMLSLRQQQGAEAFEPGKVPQSVFDAPALDASFPQHCLSRTRAALRWLVTEADLRLDAALLPEAAKETAIAELGCMVRPPPRCFAFPGQAGMFWRTSFCATDGIERFFVQRFEGRVDRPELASHAAKTTRAVHEASGVTGIELHVEEHEARPGRTDVLVIVEGVGHQGRLRNASWWLLDEGSRPWALSITSTAAMARERITAELLAAGRSWRLLR